ncbi:MAG: hypothetical protein K2Y15_11375 [Burkholderiaceae bacterium]|nr:hypothetical protein [Burkholderiaceae bacterium]HBH40220.1 hypothetical protein [Curvibacter sp.]
MFSLFRKRPSAPETVMLTAKGTRRMSLEERMAFRRELAEQVVRETLQELAVRGTDYSLRLMPLDPRHHRYIVMLDVAPGFAPSQRGQAATESEVESRIRRNAYERYGLSLEGIYWRAGAQQQAAFERRGSDRTGSSPTLAQEGLRPWELVSEEEKQALMEAIREGGELPVLHVGELEYLTDMAPLDAPQGGERRRR